MAFIPSTVFNLLEGDANYRKIQSQIAAVPTPGVDAYNVYYQVDGPLAPMKVPDFLTPDGVLNNGAPIAVMTPVNLPLDSSGSTLEGIYTITYWIENTLTPGIYSEVVSTIDLDVLKEGPEECRIQGNINFEVDCVCYRITVTDRTYYGNPAEVTFDSREVTIVFPAIPGQVTPAPIVTTDDTITVGFDYSNVTYIVNLLSVYHHQNDDGTIIVQENLIAQYSEKVMCDFNLCKLTQCLIEALAKLEYKAARIGGYPNLPIEERDLLQQIYENWMLMSMAKDCGDYKQVYRIYNRIAELVNCDCGCGDKSPRGNTDHPIPVSPSCGGAGGNITSISGTSPVLVNQTGMTAVISLDPAFISAALANTVGLLGVTVNAGSSAYLTATPNTPTAGNTELAFNATAFALVADIEWSSWTELDDSYVVSVASLVEYSSVPLPVRYAINTFQGEMKVDGQFNALQSYATICLNVDINITLPASIRVGMPIPAFNSSGDCVGHVALSLAFGGGPTDYRLIFTPNAFFVAPSVISINGKFNL